MWASAEYGNFSKSSWGPLPVGVLAALPQQSPEKRKQSRRNREDALGAVSCLLRQKHQIFWRDIMPAATGSIRRSLPFVCYKKSALTFFFSAAESLELFCSIQAWAKGSSVPCSSLAHTENCLSLVSLLCNLILKPVLWSQAQAGQSLSSQQEQPRQSKQRKMPLKPQGSDCSFYLNSVFFLHSTSFCISKAKP